jgi:glycosyltransferase involved in cell wall biosynthesis
MSLATEIPMPQPRLRVDQPLRVLLVTQASGGGVGRHFLDLAEGLPEQGVKVTGIYSPRKLDAQFRQRLAAGGLPPLYELPMRRAVHPLDVADLWRLVRLIRRLGPFDIIHGHSSKGGALARLAARWLRIPSVYTAHAFVTLDPNLPAWQSAFYGRIERWLAQRTAAIIAVSHDEAEHARGLGIAPRTIHVVPNGIEDVKLPSRDEVRSKLGLSPDDFVIGFVGRLAPQKAPDIMLDAFAALCQRQTAARLVMIGGGPLEEETRRQAERLGLGARVKMLGDVAAVPLMPAFDVFCLSSRYEGMPYVLLEALAAGLPIVAARVGGTTMCVMHGENGLIVTPESPPELAGALLQLAEDAPLRGRFAAASTRLATRFTSQQMVAQTLAVYEQVLLSAKRPQIAVTRI